MRGRGVAAYALHPGSVHTNIERDQSDVFKEALVKVAPYWGTVDECSSTSVVAAFDPALDQDPGRAPFISACQFDEPEAYASDPALADRLWALSEELTGEKFVQAGEKL